MTSGWGLCVIAQDHQGCYYYVGWLGGPVVVDSIHIMHLGADVSSNNTAELSAIAWALILIASLGVLPPTTSVEVWTDSETSGCLVWGAAVAHKNTTWSQSHARAWV